MRSMAIGLLAALCLPAPSLPAAPGPASAVAATAYAAPAGKHPVTEELGAWTDPARQRVIPYKIYRPRALDRPVPVILFSHGLGGSRHGAAYLNRYLASHGYVVIALQHPGSDEALVDEDYLTAATARGMLIKGATQRAAQDRYRDVHFAIDRLDDLNRRGPLAGKLDLLRIGMAGHSFGAVTTLVAAGQLVGRDVRASFRDDRIKAAVAYSPNRPRIGTAEAALAEVRIPMLHMTGTRDGSVLERGTTTADRKVPFEAIAGAPQYLVVLAGGDHMVFSGRRLERGQPQPLDAINTEIIKGASLAFWDAFLKGDTSGRRALEQDLPERVGMQAEFRHHS